MSAVYIISAGATYYPEPGVGDWKLVLHSLDDDAAVAAFHEWIAADPADWSSDDHWAVLMRIDGEAFADIAEHPAGVMGDLD